MGAPSVPVVVPYSRGYGVFDILTNLGYPIGTDLNGQPTSWVDFRVQLERPGALGVGNNGRLPDLRSWADPPLLEFQNGFSLVYDRENFSPGKKK